MEWDERAWTSVDWILIPELEAERTMERAEWAESVEIFVERVETA